MKTALALCRWVALALALAAGPAAAKNTIFLAVAGESSPLGTLTVWQGESVSLDLRLDFLDTTVGGGVSVLLDPALLQLDALTFGAALGDSPPLRCAPAAAAPPVAPCPGDPAALGFGSLAGLSGGRLVATLELTALANGTSSPGVALSSPFSDTTGEPLDVVFVPEPGRLAMLAAGIGQLLLLHRWRCRRRGSPTGRSLRSAVPASCR